MKNEDTVSQNKENFFRNTIMSTYEGFWNDDLIGNIDNWLLMHAYI